ncbi:hypothetical protein LOD99_7242 [Oopsacas minuta]|uniref:Uncharacterized protein n=1 Tax=Oopsacas minuta TaxID=111878 RepID=A0AAV7JUR5_9METZ|nr:hypothetical protein LOD99_7242 [Oopsacas minuta]
MIGVLQRDPDTNEDFNMIPTALNNDFPIPILTKPIPSKLLRISRPDPDLVLSPEKERSFEDSPEFIKPKKYTHTIIPKPKMKPFCEPESVETLIGNTIKGNTFK